MKNRPAGILIAALALSVMLAGEAYAVYHPGGVVVTTSGVNLPDGSMLNIAGTQTQGLQEALNFSGDYGWDVYVMPGTYSLNAGLSFPPFQGRTIRMKNVTLNFSSSVTGAAITIDSCMIVDVYITGTINAPSSTYGVMFRPTHVVPLDGILYGAFGVVDSRFEFPTINTAVYKVSFDNSNTVVWKGNIEYPAIVCDLFSFPGVSGPSSPAVYNIGSAWIGANLWGPGRNDDPIPFDPFNPACVVVVPPANFGEVGFVYAPGGAPVSTAGTQTSGLQEAINYADSHNLDLVVFGRGVENLNAYPQPNHGLYWIGATLVIPPMVHKDYRFYGGTYAYIGTGAGMTIQSALGSNFEMTGQIVPTNGAGVQFWPTAGGINCSTFRIAHICYKDIGVLFHQDTDGRDIVNSNFYFTELLGMGSPPTGYGVVVQNPPTAQSQFSNNYLHVIHDHGYTNIAFQLGSSATSRIFGNTFIVQALPDYNNALIGFQVWAASNTIYYKAFGEAVQYGIRFEPGSTNNSLYYGNITATTPITDYGTGNTKTYLDWNNPPSDSVAPVGYLCVNSGAAYTSSTMVTLDTASTDRLGIATQMRFNNEGGAWSAWRAYAFNDTWALSSGDGTKTVNAQYKDAAGNVSASCSDTVVLDSTGPTGASVIINSGAAHTTSATVTLSLTASDPVSGVSSVRFSTDGTNYGAWTGYSSSQQFTLPSGDGTKTVYAQFMDGSGNVSQAPPDSIVLDATAPTGGVNVNAGAAYTTDPAVTLSFTAADPTTGVTSVRLSPDGYDFGSWMAYSPTMPYTLSSGNGIKKVYAEFMDGVGNVTPPRGARIALGSPISIAQAKQSIPGSLAIHTGVAVTARFTDCVYLEDPGRSSGIRVTGSNLPEAGNIIDLSGTVAVISGEKTIQSAARKFLETGTVKPLGLQTKSIGGSDCDYDPITGTGQQGTGGIGLNNTGLLVRIAGAFSIIDMSNFTVDDGSGAVRCIVPDTVLIDPNWRYVIVTGASSCEADYSGALGPVVRMLAVGGITVLF